jgi:hypothetical protein
MLVLIRTLCMPPPHSSVVAIYVRAVWGGLLSLWGQRKRCERVYYVATPRYLRFRYIKKKSYKKNIKKNGMLQRKLDPLYGA